MSEEDQRRRQARAEKYKEHLQIGYQQELMRQQAHNAYYARFNNARNAQITFAGSYNRHYNGLGRDDVRFRQFVDNSRQSLDNYIDGWVRGVNDTQVEFTSDDMHPPNFYARIELGSNFRIIAAVSDAGVHVIHAGPGGL